MDVTFDESEAMLQETARRLADALACRSVSEFETFDRQAAWKALEAAGFLGLHLPERAGGGGATTVDTAIVVDALARALLPIPYLGRVALAGELLLAANAPDETLARLASGDLRLAVGLTPDLAQLWHDRCGADHAVTFDGADAEAVLVLAGDPPRLVALRPARPVVGLDITRTAIRADPAAKLDVGKLGGELTHDAQRRFHARALALLSADLVGVMDAALTTAVAYAIGRVQFGAPIGSFQAMQHLAADQLVSLEGSRSLAEYAAWAADELDTGEALQAAHCAKAYCSRAGRTLCEAVIQIHGGMGITWECMAHLYLKRAIVDGLALGNHAHNIAQLADLRTGSAA